MTNLLSLAERVEQASGWRPELDATIWLNVVATPQQAEAIEAGRKAHGDTEARFRIERMMDGARYTASLDDALTLPRQGRVILNIAEDDITTAIVDGTEATADTPALALVAACLRALSLSGNQP